MFKRINWKAIGIGLLWIISLSGLVVLMSFIEHKKTDQECVDVKVFIPGDRTFVNREEVDKILWNVSGELKGRQLNTINLQALENALKMNPFIKNAKVYADMNGVLRVRIIQREPVLRVINVKNQDFYIDDEGMKIPVSPNFTAQVLVANGNIAEDLESRVAGLKTPIGKSLFKLASFIHQDTLWSEQIEQIYVDAQSEIQLVPRLGDHQIILGNTDSLDRKFNNLLIFYKKAMPKIGWETYKTINLKYLNQVVCRKSSALPDTLATTAAAPADTLKKSTLMVKN